MRYLQSTMIATQNLKLGVQNYSQLRISFLALVLLLSTGAYAGAFAQQDNVQQVVIFHRGDDPVGRQIAEQIRANFREASDFTLNRDAELLIILHTQGINSSDSEIGVGLVNVIWTLREEPGDQFPAYLESTLGYVGQEGVQQVSEGIVSDTRQIVENILPRVQRKK